MPDLVEVLRQSERDIFDYFAEVFSDEPEEVRNCCFKFPCWIALSLTLQPSFEAELFTVLPNLVRRNVFISVASDRRGERVPASPAVSEFP